MIPKFNPKFAIFYGFNILVQKGGSGSVWRRPKAICKPC